MKTQTKIPRYGITLLYEKQIGLTDVYIVLTCENDPAGKTFNVKKILRYYEPYAQDIYRENISYHSYTEALLAFNNKYNKEMRTYSTLMWIFLVPILIILITSLITLI